MADLWSKLKQRKLVQWAVAYVAFSFALLQGIDLVAQPFGWPPSVMRLAILVLAVGFVLAILLAWYHGEQGRQRVSGTELMIIALVLAFGGVLLWFVGRSASHTATTTSPVATTAPASSAAREPASATSTAPASAIPAKSIAVLPFENLNVDKKDAYFVAGMQDLILTKLADIGDLKVISRTSTMQYGSHPQNLKKIGQELGVATLLEGSVQKAGNQVLVNVQLIDASTDSHIWANSYQRTLKNVFGVEGEVAEKIANALKAKLSPAENRLLAISLSKDPVANDLYLRGEFFANQGLVNLDVSDWLQAIPLYRKAIAKVPDFAQAHAKLSYVESELVWFGGGGKNGASLSDDARKHAQQALELAPELADAHLALGYCDYYGNAEFAKALKAFTTALALRPNDSAALFAQGLVLRRLGRYQSSLKAMKRASVLDPKNYEIAFTIGQTYMMLYRFGKAEQATQHALALNPTSQLAKNTISLGILLQSGDPARALAALQGSGGRVEQQRAYLLTLSRKYAQALSVLQSMPDTHVTSLIFLFDGSRDLRLANLYRLNGEPAQARTYYAKVLSQARSQYAKLAGSVNQPFILNFIAQAELGLGQKKAALATIAKLEQMALHSQDHVFGPQLTAIDAMLYAQAGHAGKAVTLIAHALDSPGTGQSYSRVMLWIDPVWDPIRKTPVFQALLKKYARYRPPLQHYPAPSTLSTGS